MYHSFLIHSSADGHLGCFHVLSYKETPLNVWHQKVKEKPGNYTNLLFVLTYQLITGFQRHMFPEKMGKCRLEMAWI